MYYEERINTLKGVLEFRSSPRAEWREESTSEKAKVVMALLALQQHEINDIMRMLSPNRR